MENFVDSGHNPFDQTDSTLLVTDDRYVAGVLDINIGITAIRLREVPYKEAPSNFVLTPIDNIVDGNPTGPALTEIFSGTPTASQYRIDYGDTAQGVASAIIWLHNSQSGNSFSCDYKRIGSILSRESLTRLASGGGAGTKIIGELFWLDDYTAPSASFPALCLSAADATLDVVNWGTTFIDHLRSIPLRYAPTSANKTDFDVTNWAIAANVATLTFANTAAENAILAGLAEDNLVHGSFTSWRTITLAAAIGDITAGTYAITALSTGSRTISFAFTAANNSGAVTATASFYRHRIAGSTTTARHFAASGRGFISVDDTSGAEWIGGLRRRDRMQGHYHSNNTSPSYGVWFNQNNPGTNLNAFASGLYGNVQNLIITTPLTDGTNGTPRTGSTTHGPGLAAFAYKWAGEYTP